MFCKKLFLKIFAISLILMGFVDISVGWGYLAFSATADAGQEVLKNMQDSTTSHSLHLNQTIYEIRYFQYSCAMMSILLLVLGPIVVYLGISMFHYSLSAGLGITVAILQIVVEFISYYLFLTWQFPKTISILLCCLLLLHVMIKKHQQKNRKSL